MEESEAMLRVREGDGSSQVGEDDSLQNLDRWTEEGDGSVGGAIGGGFAGFRKGDDNSCLPDGGDVCTGKGEVVE